MVNDFWVIILRFNSLILVTTNSIKKKTMKTGIDLCRCKLRRRNGIMLTVIITLSCRMKSKRDKITKKKKLSER